MIEREWMTQRTGMDEEVWRKYAKGLNGLFSIGKK